MKTYQKILCLVFFAFAVCFAQEVVLVITGRVVTDSISMAPVPNLSLQAFKREDYLGHDSMDTSSVRGIAQSNSYGYFILYMVKRAGGAIHDSDRILITAPSMTFESTIDSLRNCFVVLYTQEKVAQLQPPRGLKYAVSPYDNDTLKLEPGQAFSWYLYSWVYYGFPDGSSSVIPEWAYADECTGVVCLRGIAPQYPTIERCSLVSRFLPPDTTLFSVFTFYLLVGNPSLLWKDDITDLPLNFSVLPKGNSRFGIDIILSKPDAVSLSVYTPAGRQVAVLKERYLGAGRHYFNLQHVFSRGRSSSGTYVALLKSRSWKQPFKILIR